MSRAITKLTRPEVQCDQRVGFGVCQRKGWYKVAGVKGVFSRPLHKGGLLHRRAPE